MAYYTVPSACSTNSGWPLKAHTNSASVKTRRVIAHASRNEHGGARGPECLVFGCVEVPLPAEGEDAWPAV